MERARERWAEPTNQMLRARGREERVDHRSYERQGIDRDPGRHYGPAAAYMTARGREHDRLEEAVAHIDRQDTIALSTARSTCWRAATAAGEAPWDMKAIDHDNNATGPRPDATTTCLPGGSHAKCHRYVSGAARGC